MPAVTIGQRILFGRTCLLAQQWKKVFPVGEKSQSQTRRLFTALVHEVSYKIFPHKAEILRFYKIEMQEGFSTVIADRFCQHSSNQQNQGNFPRKDTGLDTFAR